MLIRLENDGDKEIDKHDLAKTEVQEPCCPDELWDYLSWEESSIFRASKEGPFRGLNISDEASESLQEVSNKDIDVLVIFVEWDSQDEELQWA